MSYTGPERRHSWWRELLSALSMLLAAGAVVVAYIAVNNVEGKIDTATADARLAEAEAETAKQLAALQRDGRRVALGFTCGALRGVEDAGRMVLTDRLPGTERFRRPSTPERRAMRRLYARAYNRVISERIIEEAGVTAMEVIDRTGVIDCDALRKVAAAGPAPP